MGAVHTLNQTLNLKYKRTQAVAVKKEPFLLGIMQSLSPKP